MEYSDNSIYWLIKIGFQIKLSEFQSHSDDFKLSVKKNVYRKKSENLKCLVGALRILEITHWQYTGFILPVCCQIWQHTDNTLQHNDYTLTIHWQHKIFS